MMHLMCDLNLRSLTLHLFFNYVLATILLIFLFITHNYSKRLLLTPMSLSTFGFFFAFEQFWLIVTVLIRILRMTFGSFEIHDNIRTLNFTYLGSQCLASAQHALPMLALAWFGLDKFSSFLEEKLWSIYALTWLLHIDLFSYFQ